MGLPRHRTVLRPALAALAPALLAAVALAGCGAASPASTAPSTGAASPTAAGSTPGPAASRPAAVARSAAPARQAVHLDRVRDAVVRGAARDFAQGTGIGGPAFEACVEGRLRAALDAATISRLAAVYRRPDGSAYAAQALNALASPLAARCGHRYWVPELVEAAHGLRSVPPTNAATRKLGVTYGPYLGVRCPRANHPGCGRVGIDVVFARAASRVVAIVGGHHLTLRTPGMHSGILRHDWVGTLTGAGFYRPGSPFHIGGHHPDRRPVRNRNWAGYPPVYVPVELRVRFVGGRHARALLPHVFVSPGWG